jgi:Abortive infection C-terminus
MEKLRATLVKYSRWQPYEVYVDRMEAHLEADFSVAVENAKALLEGIAKEICDSKGVVLGTSPSINAVLKKAFVGLGYPAEELVTQVSGSLANIGHMIGDLRNEISPTSHGKSLDELQDRNSKLDLLTRDFLIDSTLVVAVFLIRAFEGRPEDRLPPSKLVASVVIGYDDKEDFNNFWDESFGEFSMGDYSYTASEILFGLDAEAYHVEHKAFTESDSTDAGEPA